MTDRGDANVAATPSNRQQNNNKLKTPHTPSSSMTPSKKLTPSSSSTSTSVAAAQGMTPRGNARGRVNGNGAPITPEPGAIVLPVTPSGAATSAKEALLNASNNGGIAEHKESSHHASSPSPSPPDPDSYFHQLYQTQKERDRIISLTSSHSTLVATVGELQKQLHVNDSRHIDSLLHRKREKSEQTHQIRQLQERIEGLEQQLRDAEAKAAQSATSSEQIHSTQLQQLEDRMSIIQAKYDSLYQFKEEKSDLELKLNKYCELLEKEKESHALNVSELERRNVMEKDRLKNEMLRKIRETKLSLLAMTEDQLHTTTKRTIMENEQMTTELQYQSKETERIVKKNTKLVQENASLKRELELSESTLQQLAKKTTFYQNLISKLQAKYDSISAELQKEKMQSMQTVQALQNQVNYLKEINMMKGGGGIVPQLNASSNGMFTPQQQQNNSSSLSTLLRNVEEMNHLANSAVSGINTSTSVNILPSIVQPQQQQQQQHSSSSQSSSSRSHSSQSRHNAGSALAKSESRASNHAAGGSSGLAGSSSNSNLLSSSSTTAASSSTNPSSNPDDLLTIQRLTDRVTQLDLEKEKFESRAQQEKYAKKDALELVKKLENDVSELNSSIVRLKSQQVQTRQLSEQAMSFIVSCLEDQRQTISLKREQDASAAVELEQQTLHSVVADGTEATVVVRAAGEKPLQGTTALLEVTKADQQTAASSPAPISTPGWDASSSTAFPSSLASFSASDRASILEHLLQQMAVFQRTNPNGIDHPPTHAASGGLTLQMMDVRSFAPSPAPPVAQSPTNANSTSSSSNLLSPSARSSGGALSLRTASPLPPSSRSNMSSRVEMRT